MKKILVPAAAIAMLAACSDNTVVNSFEEAKCKGKITLSVMDGDANTPVAGASVRSQYSAATEKTDSSGYVVFDNNDIGGYIFEVSKSGYATVRSYVSVEETGANDVSRVPDVVQTIPMYKAGVTVSGNVYYRDAETGNLNPAKNVTVILSYPEASIFPSEIEMKTGKDGSYKFEDVAEKVEFSIETVQSTIDEKIYIPENSVSAVGVRTGSSKDMDMLVLKRDSKAPHFLSSNLSKMDTDKNIELTFSTALDADSLLNNWTVKRNGYAVLTTQSLSKDKKTVVIEPVSGSWSDDASYTVNGVAYSKEGGKVVYSDVFTIGSVALPGQVSNLKVFVDTTGYDPEIEEDYGYSDSELLAMMNLNLTWKAPTGDVDTYEIYYKTDESNDFVQFTYTSSTSYSETLTNLPSSITSAEKVSFYVLPKNKTGMANPEEAKPVSWTVVKF